MGNTCVKKKDVNVIRATVALIGLDNAGKTTLLSALKGAVDHDPMPTVGFSSHDVRHGKNALMTYYDLGGGSRIRGIWPRYFASLHGVIFVLDSSDRERIEEVRVSLHEAARDPHLVGKHVLIFANKQDISGCMTPEEIIEALRLDNLPQIHFNVLACVAKSPKGKPTDRNIIAGLKWLGDSLRESFSDIDERVKRERTEEKKREQEARMKKWEEIRRRKEEEEERELEHHKQQLQNGSSELGVPALKEQQNIPDEMMNTEQQSSQQGQEIQPSKPVVSGRFKRNQIVPVGEEEILQQNESV